MENKVSQIYKLSQIQLKRIFGLEDPQNRGPCSLTELKQHGTFTSFLSKLASDPSSGIMGDERDLARRKVKYGKNTKQLPQRARLVESIA
jgi:hypothetical protein